MPKAEQAGKGQTHLSKEETKPTEKEKAAEKRTPEPQVQKTEQAGKGQTQNQISHLPNEESGQADQEQSWKPGTERSDKEQAPQSSNEEPKLTENKQTLQSPRQEAKRTEDEPQEEPRAGRAAEAFQRICGRLRALADRLRSLGERIVQLGRRIIALPETIQKQAEKMVGLLKKPGELLEQLAELEEQEVFGSVFGYLTELIIHYKPRSIEGYLHFGTGDPAVTGWLTGLAYLLLPARAERFSVEPEFTEKVLETKLICAGRLRACHLLRAGWKALRNKKLRTFINAVRKRGE